MEEIVVAHRFLQRDALHRISLYVSELRKRWPRGTLHPEHRDRPEYGFVDDPALVPFRTVSPPHEKHKHWEPSLHYVSNGEYLYFPTMSLVSDGALKDPIFLFPEASFQMTPLLLWRIWNSIQQESETFPEIPGMDFVIHDGREEDLRILRKAGYHVQMGGYTKRDMPLSTSRLLATGFVAKFGLPGEEELTTFNKLDNIEAMIRKLEEHQPTQGDASVVDLEGRKFIQGLKDMCYDIQSEHGPFAAKYAWEVYKRTARFLTQNSEREVS